MLPRNVIEAAVFQSLEALRDRDPGTATTCWCPLCAADMRALALSAIPPRYVTRREDRAGVHNGRDRVLHEEVARAVAQVASHCKHQPGDPTAEGDDVALVNLTYEVAFSLIQGRVQRREGACGCFDCRCDAVAFALNRFPPRYGVALCGSSVFGERSRLEMGAEMTAFLDLGVSVVAGHPRH